MEVSEVVARARELDGTIIEVEGYMVNNYIVTDTLISGINQEHAIGLEFSDEDRQLKFCDAVHNAIYDDLRFFRVSVTGELYVTGLATFSARLVDISSLVVIRDGCTVHLKPGGIDFDEIGLGRQGAVGVSELLTNPSKYSGEIADVHGKLVEIKLSEPWKSIPSTFCLAADDEPIQNIKQGHYYPAWHNGERFVVFDAEPILDSEHTLCLQTSQLTEGVEHGLWSLGRFQPGGFRIVEDACVQGKIVFGDCGPFAAKFANISAIAIRLDFKRGGDACLCLWKPL